MFRSKACRFRDTSLSKIDMQRMTPELPKPLNCRKYPAYIECLPLVPKFHPGSLYDQPFVRYKVEIRNAPNDPGLTSSTELSKVPCLHRILTPDARISRRFTLRPAVFEMLGLSKIRNAQNDPRMLRMTLTT